MSEDEPERTQRFIRGLCDGNETVLFEFCRCYAPQLNRLADKYLGARLQRRVGPEDVVQSACRTFFRRAKGGEFQLTDGEALWRLLCAITLTKVRDHARFHMRQKRVFETADPEQTPAEAVEFSDFFEHVRAGLDDEERQVVDLKLQECTNDEVAESLGLSERTVRRILKRFQPQLTRALQGT